jgi:hypothetical protein
MLNAFLNLCLYWNVCAWDNKYALDDPNNSVADQYRYINNIKGFAFLMACNLSFTSASGVIH